MKQYINKFKGRGPKLVAPTLAYLKVDLEDGQTGSGSGFLVTENGMALTCSHVVEGAISIRARFEYMPDRWLSAKTIGVDKASDLALIQIDDAPRYAAAINDTEDTAGLGNEVGLLAFWYGDDSVSFTRGVVNKWSDEGGLRHYYIDSGATPGCSGAPVYDLEDGRVLGVLQGGLEHEHQGNATINRAVDIQEFLSRFTDA